MPRHLFPSRDPRDPDPDAIMGEHRVLLLFKHSPLCLVSASARDQVERWARTAPTLPVTVVDVLRERELSQRVAARTGVRHQSPQVLLLRDGRVVWHASHGDITATALARAVASIPDPEADGRAG